MQPLLPCWFRLRLPLLAAVSLCCGVLPVAHAQDGKLAKPGKKDKIVFADAEQAKAALELIADAREVHPGETITLGLRFVMQPKWHIYWNGSNDTGSPPTWKVRAPEGWKVDEAAKEGRNWPVPQLYTSAAETNDFVYFDEVVLLQRVTVPADAKPGTYTIGVDAKWLVCEDACIPEKGSSEREIVVVEGEKRDEAKGEPSAKQVRETELIQRAIERVPKAWTAEYLVKPGELFGVTKLEREGERGEKLRIEAASFGLTFMPSARSLPVRLADAKVEQSMQNFRGTSALLVEVDTALAEGMRDALGIAADADVLRGGVIEGIVTGAGSGRPVVFAYWIRLPAPDAEKTSKATTPAMSEDAKNEANDAPRSVPPR